MIELNRHIFLKILGFFLILNSLGYAQQSGCGQKVFLPKQYFKSSGEKMVQYDQGNTGICYAYAGVEMVDYFWKTSGAKFQNTPDGVFPELNALYAAYLAKKNKIFTKLIGKFSPIDGTPLDAGDPSDVVDIIREKGMCRKEVIEESFKEYAKSLGITNHGPEVMTQFLHTWFSDYYNSKKGLKWYESWNSQKSREFKERQIKNACNGPMKENCGEMKIALDKLMPAFEKGKYLSIYDEMFKLCQNPQSIYRANMVIPPLDSKLYLRMNDPIAVKKRIVELFDKPKPTPVLIAYCANVLWNSQSRGNPCSRHVSVLIGKREKAGKCQFFLKNTWGEECSGLDKKWECEEENDPYRAKKHFTFGIWVDADDLAANIYAIKNFK